jgi:hypothetical protein
MVNLIQLYFLPFIYFETIVDPYRVIFSVIMILCPFSYILIILIGRVVVSLKKIIKTINPAHIL